MAASFWRPGSAAPAHPVDRDAETGAEAEASAAATGALHRHLQGGRTGYRVDVERRTLPIFEYRTALLYSVEQHGTTIVVGETGCGKSTQLPQYLMEAGWASSGFMIACTQPRRIAATSLAARVAEEMGVQLGAEVGYAVRFDEQSTDGRTRIKYLTDGMLLREMMTDPLLSRYSVVVVDEAHERSLNTDVLLGLLKKVRRARPELRLLIASATLEAERFRDFFDEEGEAAGAAPRTTQGGHRFDELIGGEGGDDADDDDLDIVERSAAVAAVAARGGGSLGNDGPMLVLLPAAGGSGESNPLPSAPASIADASAAPGSASFRHDAALPPSRTLPVEAAVAALHHGAVSTDAAAARERRRKRSPSSDASSGSSGSRRRRRHHHHHHHHHRVGDGASSSGRAGEVGKGDDSSRSRTHRRHHHRSGGGSSRSDMAEAIAGDGRRQAAGVICSTATRADQPLSGGSEAQRLAHPSANSSVDHRFVDDDADDYAGDGVDDGIGGAKESAGAGTVRSSTYPAPAVVAAQPLMDQPTSSSSAPATHAVAVAAAPHAIGALPVPSAGAGAVNVAVHGSGADALAAAIMANAASRLSAAASSTTAIAPFSTSATTAATATPSTTTILPSGRQSRWGPRTGLPPATATADSALLIAPTPPALPLPVLPPLPAQPPPPPPAAAAAPRLHSARIIAVEGRTFPVDVQYVNAPVGDYVVAAAETALALVTHAAASGVDGGDVLVFLPGAEEVERCCDLLREHFPEA